MNHDQIRESLEAYAIGALDEPELREVRDHVTTCDECRAALDGYEQIAATLPLALAASSPVAPSDVAAQRIRRVIRRQALRSRLGTIVSAVAVVLLFVAAAWIWRSQRTLADERDRTERLVEELFLTFEVTDSPDTNRIALRANDADGNWYGKVYTRPDMPFVVMMANRLPEPEDGSEYHVWITIDDDATVLAGVLEPDDDGFDPLVYMADANGPVITDVVVTAQQPGSAQPAGPVILAATDD